MQHMGIWMGLEKWDGQECDMCHDDEGTSSFNH